MIAPGTRIIVDEVPLDWIVVTEHQPRYPDRVLHYYRLLTDPAYAGHFAGLVSLTPHGANISQGHPIYTLLDGHHRYCASIMAGRRTLLAAIHYPPDETTTRAVTETENTYAKTTQHANPRGPTTIT